jgi:UDP-glucose 4-epimerase
MRTLLDGIDDIVDLAHNSVPKTSFDDPVSDILDNLPAAVRFFQTACSFPLRRVVFVSSGGTVYGKAQHLPITEDHATVPISPYGITKLAIEKYGKMFQHLQGLPLVIVRPANAFGEGQRPLAGQGFVATAIAAILRGDPVPIYGASGTIRDYLHVADVADAIVAALTKGSLGATYNIGSGLGRSNLEIVQIIGKYLGRDDSVQSRVVRLPARPFDVPANVLDSSRLRQDTGWELAIPFEQGIETTLNSHLAEKRAA